MVNYYLAGHFKLYSHTEKTSQIGQSIYLWRYNDLTSLYKMINVDGELFVNSIDQVTQAVISLDSSRISHK